MFVAKSHLEPYYKDAKKLEADLKVIADSSAEDDRLFEWLLSDDDVWPALGPVFERRMNTRKGFEAWLLKADQARFVLTEDLKRVGAFFVILELREFGGHTLWNRVGKTPHYEDILKNVHDRVSARFKAPLRKDMSVTDRELSLSAMILKESLEELSPDMVSTLLKESQFESVSDFNQIRSSLLSKLSQAGTSGFQSYLGKAAVRKFAPRLIEKAFGAQRFVGLAKLGAIASRVAPSGFRRAGLYLSLGFLMKDAYDLGGEATRVTNPAVIIISLYRSFSGR